MEGNKDEICLQKAEELIKYPRITDWVDRWAKEKPDNLALIEYDTGEEVTYKDFKTKINAFAAKLLSLGINKGDVVATTLVLLKEHVYLMHACYRIGAIIAPLDPRLKVDEVDYMFQQMKPKMYLCLGKTPVNDFRPIITSMMKKHGVANGGPCKYFIQFDKVEENIIDGAIGITEFASNIKKIFIKSMITGSVKKAAKKISKRDPILIIFTTGSTGYPKAALMCSENILLQNIGLSVAFEIEPDDTMLVNLPPSHVGCVTEQLATVLFGGGTALIMHIFDPEKSLDAIQKYKATFLGQIPALFAMEWRLPNYKDYDLSSLKFALYGGQAVTKKFLEQMMTMAKYGGTGLGLTETAGFCTYTPIHVGVDEMLVGIGFDSPLCPLSIREPMKENGYAGKEIGKGEVGEICFEGPQIFLGYLNNPEQTAKAISTDGILYTGDVGSYDETGLHFSGRSKFIIKPKGYQVFPTEIEETLQSVLKEDIQDIAIAGAHHEVFSEGLIAFIVKKEGSKITEDDVKKAAQSMAAYKRPTHIEFVDELPLNRVSKTDYKTLFSNAEDIALRLRKEGGWDAE